MFFILVGKSENDHDKGCRTLNPVRPILSVPWKLYEGLPRSPAAYLTWPEMSFNGVYGRSRYKFWFWQAGPKNCFIYWCSWGEPSTLNWAFKWAFTNKFIGKMWKTCRRHHHTCHPCHRHHCHRHCSDKEGEQMYKQDARCNLPFPPSILSSALNSFLFLLTSSSLLLSSSWFPLFPSSSWFHHWSSFDKKSSWGLIWVSASVPPSFSRVSQRKGITCDLWGN